MDEGTRCTCELTLGCEMYVREAYRLNVFECECVNSHLSLEDGVDQSWVSRSHTHTDLL